MKTVKLVRSIGKSNFETDVDAAIALGYNDTSNPINVEPGQTSAGDIYTQELVNPGTNTPTITVDTVELPFGDVEFGSSSNQNLLVIATNLTGNITVTSSNPQFTVGTNPMVPDVDGAVDANNVITFTPDSDDGVERQAYLTLETDGGQTIVVIVTGTGIPVAP